MQCMTSLMVHANMQGDSHHEHFYVCYFEVVVYTSKELIIQHMFLCKVNVCTTHLMNGP